jgi:hypothetical protein
MISIDDIVTGEKIQKLAELYIGSREDFIYNPNIKSDDKLKLDINNINREINNPTIIFCYSHRLKLLSEKISLFKNNFILLTHNSDENIYKDEYIYKILNCDKLIKWFGQNLTFTNKKLHLLSIGIANSQWIHGNLSYFTNPQVKKNMNNKSEFIYFNFKIDSHNIDTYKKRTECYTELKDKIKWLERIHPQDNITRLSKYKYCVCPEGNGLDTHRTWECLYLKTIPIMLKSNFSLLLENNLPIVLLNNWKELNLDVLIRNYENYLKKIKNIEKYLKFSNIVEEIRKDL